MRVWHPRAQALREGKRLSNALRQYKNMIAEKRSYQIIQGVTSLGLGGLSIVLSMTLQRSGHRPELLSLFLVIGVTMIFTGDYLINLFRMPVTPEKQEIASDVGFIAYGAFYIGIAMSQLLQFNLTHLNPSFFLQPLWIRRGVAGIGIILIAGGIQGLWMLWKQTKQEETSE